MNFRTYLVCRIIFTFIFMISSTYIWFNKRNNTYHYVESNFMCNEIVFSNINKNSNEVYNLKVENKENTKQNVKVYIVPSLFDNNLSNNYIKYQVNDSEIKTLNMDGMIFVSTLDGNNALNLNLKLWVSDTYNGDLTYSGRIVVA